ARDRDRGRAVDPQRLPPGVVALRHRARAGGRAGRLPRRAFLPAGRAPARPGHLPVRRAAVLRQRHDVPRRGAADGPGRPPTAPRSRDGVRGMAGAAPPPTWIVIAAEPMTDVDTTASDVLEDLDEALNDQGISLVFAELKDPVRRKIERYGLTRTINPQHFFP